MGEHRVVWRTWYLLLELLVLEQQLAALLLQGDAGLLLLRLQDLVELLLLPQQLPAAGLQLLHLPGDGVVV